MSDEEYMQRLMSQLRKDASGCWLWTGPVNEWGYGYFAGRGDGTAHRAMYRITHGVKFTKGMRVCHTCDVRLCANPDHLWLGTQQQNIKDCAIKGRHTNGAKTHCRRGHEFTPENTKYTDAGNGRKRRSCAICNRILQRVQNGWTLEEALATPDPIPISARRPRRDLTA